MILIILAALLFLPACWDKRELNEIDFILAYGIDLNDNGMVTVTSQIVNVSATSKSDDGTGGQEAFWCISAEGKTFQQAAERWQLESGRHLCLCSTRLVVLGPGVAKQGVDPYLDYLLRAFRPQLLVPLVVSSHLSAKELLALPHPAEKLPAVAYRNIEKKLAETYTITGSKLQDFQYELLTPGQSPLLDIIELAPGSKDRVRIQGAAVFQGDKMVGSLDEAETRGAMWVKNKVRGGSLTVPCPKGQGDLSFRITGSQSKVEAYLEEGEPRATIKVKAELDLENEQCLETTLKLAPLNNQLAARAIKQEIEAAIARAQELKSDFLGFGTAFYRHYPQQWELMAANWENFYLPSLSVTVDVEAKVSRSGMLH